MYTFDLTTKKRLMDQLARDKGIATDEKRLASTKAYREAPVSALEGAALDSNVDGPSAASLAFA